MNTEKLGDLVKITIGRTPSRGNSNFWDTTKISRNLWLSIADLIHTNGRIVNDSKEYITDIAASSFETVPKGTLLVSFKLTLGRLAFAGRDLRTNEAIAALRNDESQVLNEYLYHYLSHFNWQEFAVADQKVKGLTLNKSKLSQILVTFPESREEQRAIIKRLDGAFEKIDRAIELTQKNLQNSQRLFDQLIEQRLAPASDWAIKTFGEVTELKQGLAINAKTKHLLVERSGLPLLRIKDLKNNHFSQYVNEEKCPESVKVSKDDILYTRTGQVGLVFRGFSGALHNNSFKVTSDGSVTNDYLFWYLQNPKFKERIVGLSSRTAQPDITHKIFKVQQVCFPKSKEIQHKIVSDILKASSDTISLRKLYGEKLKKLEELKRSMLEEAFRGSSGL